MGLSSQLVAIRSRESRDIEKHHIGSRSEHRGHVPFVEVQHVRHHLALTRLQHSFRGALLDQHLISSMVTAVRLTCRTPRIRSTVSVEILRYIDDRPAHAGEYLHRSCDDGGDPSGSVSARRLGTNSPRIKDTYVMLTTITASASGSAKRKSRDLLESPANRICDGRLPEGAAQNPNTRDAYCTLERKRVGSDASDSARAAPRCRYQPSGPVEHAAN